MILNYILYMTNIYNIYIYIPCTHPFLSKQKTLRPIGRGCPIYVSLASRLRDAFAWRAGHWQSLRDAK